jgi:hypothetical protein
MTRSPRAIAADLASLARELDGAARIDVTAERASFFEELSVTVDCAARCLRVYVRELETRARATAGWTVEVLRGEQWELWWGPGVGPMVADATEQAEKVVEQLLRVEPDAVWRLRCQH